MPFQISIMIRLFAFLAIPVPHRQITITLVLTFVGKAVWKSTQLNSLGGIKAASPMKETSILKS
jgi:hypothetical protein